MKDELELFDAYERGQLEGEELASLGSRLRSDAVLAGSYRSFIATRTLVEVAGEAHLKRHLQVIHAAVVEGGTTGRVLPFFSSHWMAIAASVVLAVGAIWFFAGNERSAQQLFSEYMVPYATPDRPRSSVAGVDANWEAFTDKYAQANYDEALADLDRMNVAAVPVHLVAFYRGQCLLLKTRPDPQAAALSFASVLHTDNDLHQAARWYLAMASLRTGNEQEAMQYLKELRRTGSFKQKEAAALLRSLEKH